MRALVLAAAKQRAAEALRLKDDTSLFAPYSPSPHAMIDALWGHLARENVTIAPQDLIVDLGCGDARWLVSGVQRFGCSALGIELDEAVVAKALHNVEQQQLQHKIRVVQDDIMKVDIAQARLVIVYAFAESLQGIREHLILQLKASASILSIGVSAVLSLGIITQSLTPCMVVPRARLETEMV